jgi:hypothetical protein
VAKNVTMLPGSNVASERAAGTGNGKPSSRANVACSEGVVHHGESTHAGEYLTDSRVSHML